jgi:hypothetical protein
MCPPPTPTLSRLTHTLSIFVYDRFVSSTKITYTRAELLALSTSPISTSRAAHLSTVGLPVETSRSHVERKEMAMGRLASVNGSASEGGGDGDVLAPVAGDAGELGGDDEGRTETATTTEKGISADEQFTIDL